MNFFTRIGTFFSRLHHRLWDALPNRRKIVQLFCALLYNANIKGFISGNIYQGASKSFCVPGMNCYSCPGAIGACPLGSLQNALAGAKTKTIYYVLGILLLYGILFGRTICGWLCPFGLLQDLLYKIKSFKIKKGKWSYYLSRLKYVLLFGLVIVLPLIYGFQNLAVPAFCKYICPVGTLEGAYGLMLNSNNVSLLSMLGSLFSWKSLILIFVLVMSVLIFRPFCRFLCPLGAIYSFFSRLNLISITVDEKKCTRCGICTRNCLMDVKKVGDGECIQCGKCIPGCPVKAIHYRAGFAYINSGYHPKEEATKNDSK